MALTYSNTINYGVRSDRFQKGTKQIVAEITVGATTDYSSGFTIAATALGMNEIETIYGASLRTSADALVDHVGIYDYNTSKLRFYVGSVEFVASTINGHKVRCVVQGV